MAFLILTATAALFGHWTLRPLGLSGGPAGAALRLLTGLSLLALTTLLLGRASLAVAGYALYALAMIGFAVDLYFHRRRISALPKAPHGPRAPWTPFEIVCVMTLAVSLAASLISALAPATSWDATIAHLALPKAYVRMGQIAAFEDNAYSGYPQLMHALFTLAYQIGGESTAMLVNWLVAVCVCGVAYGVGSHLAGRRAGFVAAAMLSTAPIFIDQAGATSIDLACAGFGLAALYALLKGYEEGRFRWLVLAGFLAGSAAGVRHTGYLMVALLTLGVFITARERRRVSSALFFVSALAAMFPWLLHSALEVGNPFYPFLMSIFPGRGLPDNEITSVGTHESLRGTNLLRFVMFPWDIVMRPYWYDGWSKSPGPWVLLLGVPGLFIGGPRARALAAYCIAGGICLFFFRQSARYLLPFLLPMMPVAAAAAVRLPLHRTITTLLLASFAFGIALAAASVSFKVPVAFGFQTRSEYLTSRIERYPLFSWANTNLPPDKRVLTLDLRGYFLDMPAYQNFEALKPLGRLSHAEQLEWLRARGIAYLLFPETYVEQSKSYRETGVLETIYKWRMDGRHFNRLWREEIENPRGGREWVSVYLVRYDVP